MPASNYHWHIQMRLMHSIQLLAFLWMITTTAVQANEASSHHFEHSDHQAHSDNDWIEQEWIEQKSIDDNWIEQKWTDANWYIEALELQRIGVELRKNKLITALSQQPSTKKPEPFNRDKVVIIIDDMGNGFALGERAINLPGSVTYSFLPFTPATRWLAKQAHLARKEVMLHAPMTSLRQLRLGPGALTTEMNQRDFLAMLRDSIKSVPYARGVNNHMGSQLTQMEEPMDWLMSELNSQNLYFVDSRTAVNSVALKLAKSANIPNLGRDVFLDNDHNADNIAQSFDRLIGIAKTHGLAIGIGHPHVETLEFLEQAIIKLDEQGIDLVFASEAIEYRHLTVSRN